MKRLGILVLVVVGLVFIVRVATVPYSFHIGGGTTISGTWTGVAEGTSTKGEPYAVQMNLATPQTGKAGCFAHQCEVFTGTATVCTKKGEYQFTGLDATAPLGTWWSLDGDTMTVGLDNLQDKASPQDTSVTLIGTWKGPAFLASDGGYFADVFAPDGSPRSSTSTADKSDTVALVFRPGDFTAMCHHAEAGA